MSMARINVADSTLRSRYNNQDIVLEHVNGFADTIQTLARYVLSDFPIRCSSYNIFFYHLKNQIHAKIFPRFTASPLYMGYRITNVMDETSKKRIIETLRSEKYFG